MGRQADLRNIFSDPNFKPLSDYDRKRLKLKPHEAFYNEREGIMVLVLRQSEVGVDYSINSDALSSIVAMQEQVRIKRGYAIQVPLGSKRVAGQNTCFNLADIVFQHRPRPGQWGAYYYLKEGSFEVVPEGGASGPGGSKFARLPFDVAEARPKRKVHAGLFEDEDEEREQDEAYWTPPRRRR